MQVLYLFFQRCVFNTECKSDTWQIFFKHIEMSLVTTWAFRVVQRSPALWVWLKLRKVRKGSQGRKMLARLGMCRSVWDWITWTGGPKQRHLLATWLWLSCSTSLSSFLNTKTRSNHYIYFIGLFWGLNELIFIKHLKLCIVWNEHK